MTAGKESWQHGATSLEFLPILRPTLTISDRAHGLPSPKESTRSAKPAGPATESKGPKHLAPVGDLHMICIHLHTHPCHPCSRGPQSKDVK